MTQQQKDKIFELAKNKIDKIIIKKASYDDTLATNTEDLILDITQTVLTSNEFKDFVNLDTLENYQNIIDLTQEFMNWLLKSGKYDFEFYDENYILRFKINNEIKINQIYKSKIDNRLFKILDIFTDTTSKKEMLKIEALEKQKNELETVFTSTENFRHLLLDLVTEN